MTTIAYRDGIMAADTRSSYNSGIVEPGEIRKLWCLRRNRSALTLCFATVGSATACRSYIRTVDSLLTTEAFLVEGLLDASMSQKIAHEDTYLILLAVQRTRTGPYRSLYYIDAHGWHAYEPPPEFCAWGSGRDIALGAMAASPTVTAKQAVEIAAGFDGRTGLPVHTFDSSS